MKYKIVTVSDTKEIARRRGVWAAHEQTTPLCPYSSIYQCELYDHWYDGLASERRFIAKTGHFSNFPTIGETN